MAMESLESLQAYLQGLMNLGGTTSTGRPLIQALFTAMDDTVNDINSVYTTQPSCKPQNIDDMAIVRKTTTAPCTVLTAAQARINGIETQTAAAAIADPKTDLSPLKAKLDAAKADLVQAVSGFTSSGVCGKD
ncbi:hypothetical protein SBRCBS47491_005006 [Sporothrix bragantina]|uniref:Mediator of RNA polymerase II transcription subunit 21 n=1 Tax=Sporothrix bragantina TaxID=671064 RepID=A0ABP0BTW0_9PEZI